MLNKYIFEDKTKEKVLLKACKKLNVLQNDIIYEIKEEKNGLFSKISILVIKKSDLLSLLNIFFSNLGKYLNILIDSEIIIDDKIVKINLNSNMNANLIGKNGKVLNSIQRILKIYVENQTGRNLKLNIDIEDYNKRKIKKLEKQIRKIIKEVQTMKIDVKLNEMNSYERRIVHNIVSEYEDVTSESKGIAPNRYVIIKYVER